MQGRVGKEAVVLVGLVVRRVRGYEADWRAAMMGWPREPLGCGCWWLDCVIDGLRVGVRAYAGHEDVLDLF